MSSTFMHASYLLIILDGVGGGIRTTYKVETNLSNSLSNSSNES